MTINGSHAQNAYQTWVANVSSAASAFEGRWTMLALRRVAPTLAEDLDAQRELWHEAQFLYRSRADGHDELLAQGAAMCRGYAAAVLACEDAGMEDDAYVLGRCLRTGTTVAITHQKAAGERVRELHGEKVVLLSPDEVASLFGSIEALKAISAIKQRFPGAEIIEKYPDEPAKEDGNALAG
jgi:hypothetical protein